MVAQVTADGTTVSRSDSIIDRRVWVTATNDFTPWFLGDILAYLVRCSQDNFIDDEVELDWFMAMSDLGDILGENS